MKTKLSNQFFKTQRAMNFYDDTSKRQMYLIIEQLANKLKNKNQDWLERAIEERKLIIQSELSMWLYENKNKRHKRNPRRLF